MPEVTKIKEEIMKEDYCAPYTAHPGSTKMYQNLRHNFWWDGMKKDISKFVDKCLVCQQVKVEHRKLSGLLVQLPFLNGNGVTLSWILLLDFLGYFKD